jgi:Uma2 family endonuclease
MATTSRYLTDEELLRAPRDGQKHERVDGEMRVSPAGGRHSGIILRLGARLLAHVSERQLGHVFESSIGFRWPGRKPDQPDNVRSPDVSFVAAGRLPEEREPVGFAALAPDLAVEVLSPRDRPGDVLEKVGEDVVPGFSCPLKDLLG